MKHLLKVFDLTIIFAKLYPIQTTAQIIFTSSNLPIIILDTNGLKIPYDDPRIIAEMGIYITVPVKSII